MALRAMPQADQSHHPLLPPMWGSLDGGCGRIIQARTDEEGSRQQLGMGPMDRLECGKWEQEPYILSTGTKSICQSSQRKEGQEQRKVQGTRCTRKWRAFLSILATVPICSGGSICHRYNSTALVCGEICGTALCQSGVDSGSAESLSRSNWITPGTQGYPGQNGEFRDEEDHVGPSQVHSGPWKGSQATFGVAGSQVAAQGEVGAALECFAGRLAKTDRKFRQAAGAIQYVDPTSDHRIALCSEFNPATQCQSCSRSKSGVPHGRSPCRKSRCCHGGRRGEEAQGENARDHRKSSQDCCVACHRDRGCGCLTSGKASKIKRATSTRREWWKHTSAVRLYLRNGSIVSCLRKVQCGPLPNHKAVVFSDVEAYGNDCCAASMPDPAALALSPAVHSVIFEEDCIFDFEAIGCAQLLHGEVMADETDAYLATQHQRYNPYDTHFQTDPTMNDRFPLGLGSTISCHPHVFDRWCDGLEGSDFHVPCERLSITAASQKNHSTTPLRYRLFDERNSVSTSVGSAEYTHIEGLERIGDPEDEQLVIIDGWQDLLDLLHQHTPSPDLLIHLEMYGLHITHHSIRITDCEATIAAIREAVQQSWRDAMPPRSVAYIHLVRPQEQRHARAVVLQLIVEIVPFGVDIPPNDVPILRRIRWHGDHSMTLETAYMRDHQTGYELLFDAHLDEWCHPRHGVQCNLHIESRIALMAHRHQLLPGSLLEIFVHNDDRPEPSTSSQHVDPQSRPQQPGTGSSDVLQEWLADWPTSYVALVMHGLFGSSLGTRYATSTVNPQQVHSAVLHAWQDHIQPETSVTLHMIRPQDDQHPDHLHLIVELTNPSQVRPTGYLPILQRITWHNIWHGDTSAAVYRFSGQNTRELLAACSLAEWCGPSTRALCRIQVERRSIPVSEHIDLQAGSLLEVFVSLQHVEEDAVSSLQEKHSLRTPPQPMTSVSLNHPHVSDLWCDGLLDSESIPGSFRPYDVSNAVPTCQFRPNPDIRIPFDEDLPIVRHTEQGPTVIGRHIPPPNWSQSTLFRAASAAGAVSRTTQGQLFVRVRTWVIEHVDGGRYAPRDFTMRAQLLVRLREKIKRVWQDVIGPDDHLGIHVVRPAPFADADGTRYLPILAEANRPGRCTIQPVLFAVREITALGVSPPEWCACLVPSVFSVADIHAACQPAGELHQLLVPQGSHDQRWMGPRHTRTATVGLFVPVWWDDRLQRSEEDQDSTSLLQASALAIPPWPPSPFGMAVEEAASLMQRPLPSRAPNLTPTFLAGLHLPLRTVLLDMDRPVTETVADFWPYETDPSSVVALYPVTDPPVSTRTGPQPMLIAHQSQDRFEQEHPDDVLAVVTVSFQRELASRERRHRFKVLWVPWRGTRANYIDYFRMTGHCRMNHIMCFLYLNNVIWPETDGAIRSLTHGDHLRLQIRADDNTDWCSFEYMENAARQRRIFESSPEPVDDPADAEQSSSSISEPRSRSRSRNPPDEESDSHSLIQIRAVTLISEPFHDYTSQILSSSQQHRDSHHDPFHPHVIDRWCDDEVHVADSFVDPENVLSSTTGYTEGNPDLSSGLEHHLIIDRPRPPLRDISNVAGTIHHHGTAKDDLRWSECLIDNIATVPAPIVDLYSALFPEEAKPPTTDTECVRIVHHPLDTLIPDYIELTSSIDEMAVQNELQHWGFPKTVCRRIHLDGDPMIYFAVVPDTMPEHRLLAVEPTLGLLYWLDLPTWERTEVHLLRAIGLAGHRRAAIDQVVDYGKLMICWFVDCSWKPTGKSSIDWHVASLPRQQCKPLMKESPVGSLSLLEMATPIAFCGIQYRSLTSSACLAPLTAFSLMWSVFNYRQNAKRRLLPARLPLAHLIAFESTLMDLRILPKSIGIPSLLCRRGLLTRGLLQ